MISARTRILGLSLAGLLTGCPAERPIETGQADLDQDGVLAPEDCDDGDDTIAPGLPETCDGQDNDCDGEIDEDPVNGLTLCADADGDGHGDASTTRGACAVTPGWVTACDDCDDTSTTLSPSAAERCDALDNDCDGLVDDEDPDVLGATWYADADGDLAGDPATTRVACEAEGWVDTPTDCDDTSAEIVPGAVEICDDLDNDCDGLVDDADPLLVGASTWHQDADGDGFGDPLTLFEACDPGEEWIGDASDCDDTTAEVSPLADEICDGLDNDCDGGVDASDPDVTDLVTRYLDLDGDGFAGPTAERVCERGGFETPTDCDDTTAGVHPGLDEICDGLDNDCDDTTSEDGLITRVGGATFTDLQTAIDATAEGDTLHLCAGEYGPVVVDHTLELVGLHGLDDTILDADGEGAALWVTGGDLYAEGLTFTGGTGEAWYGPLSGGGIHAYDASSLTLVSCRVRGNAATFGGGVLGSPSNVFSDVEIVDNLAEEAGGGFYGGDLTFTDVWVHRNHSTNGGGLYVEWGASRLDTSTSIEDNIADEAGGNVYLGMGTALFGGRLEAGEASQGGGLFVDGTAIVQDTTLSGNVAVSGGAIFSTWGTLEGTRLALSGNTATEGGGLYLDNDGRANLDACAFTDNVATSGGGVWISSGALTFTDTTWSGNRPEDAASAAGSYVLGATGTCDVSGCAGDCTIL